MCVYYVLSLLWDYVCVDALEKMDGMLSSLTAWQSQYRGVAVAEAGQDSGDLKVPECAEMFVTLMTTILGQ